MKGMFFSKTVLAPAWLGVWLVCVATASVAQAQGDLTPAMIAETDTRIQTQYGIKLPFLVQTLENVPVYKATSAFLGKYGSSMGIYFRKTLYLNENLFDAKGVDVSSPVNFGVLIHEAWHAYYDQVLSSTNRTAIEKIWANHYGTAGKGWDDSVWIGDEAVGNYLQGLSSLYANVASRKKAGKKLGVTLLNLYKRDYAGQDVYGYDDNGDMAPLPISAKEVQFALKIMGTAFPDPAILEAELEKRFPTP